MPLFDSMGSAANDRLIDGNYYAMFHDASERHALQFAVTPGRHV
jgi:hypothetical protein